MFDFPCFVIACACSKTVIIRPDFDVLYASKNGEHGTRRFTNKGNVQERNQTEEQGNSEQIHNAPEQKEYAVPIYTGNTIIVYTPYKLVTPSLASDIIKNASPPPPLPIPTKTKSVISLQRVDSSIRAKREEFLLRAEQIKAEIKTNLMDKQLEVDLANLEEKR